MIDLRFKQLIRLTFLLIFPSLIWGGEVERTMSTVNYLPVPYGESDHLYSSSMTVYGLLITTDESSVTGDLDLSSVEKTTTDLRPSFSPYCLDDSNYEHYFSMKTLNSRHTWEYDSTVLINVEGYRMDFFISTYLPGLLISDTVSNPCLNINGSVSSSTNMFQSLNIAYLYLGDLFSTDTSNYPAGLLNDDIAIPRSLAYFNFPALFFEPDILDEDIYLTKEYVTGASDNDPYCFLSCTLGKLVTTTVKVVPEDDEDGNPLPNDCLVVESDYAGFVGSMYTKLPIGANNQTLPQKDYWLGSRGFYTGKGEVWINGDIYYTRDTTLGADSYSAKGSELETVSDTVSTYLTNQSKSHYTKTVNSDGSVKMTQNHLIQSEVLTLSVPHIKTASGGIHSFDDVSTIDLSTYSDRDYIASYAAISVTNDPVSSYPYILGSYGYQDSYYYSDMVQNEMNAVSGMWTTNFATQMNLSYGTANVTLATAWGRRQMLRGVWSNRLQALAMIGGFVLKGLYTYHVSLFDFSTQITQMRIQSPILAVESITTASQQTIYSDASLKRNIVGLESALDRFMKLNCVEFQWDNNSLPSETKEIGLIAQEVQELFPSLVDSSEGILSIDSTGLMTVMIKSLQEAYEEGNEKLLAYEAELNLLYERYKNLIQNKKVH